VRQVLGIIFGAFGQNRPSMNLMWLPRSGRSKSAVASASMHSRVKYAKAVSAFQNVYRDMRNWRTCPNCHQRIDLDSALGVSGWSKLAPSNCGVRCPNCKKVLAARQRRGFAVFWAVLAVVTAIVMLGRATGRLSVISVALIELGLLVFVWFMRRWRVRSLIELSLPPPGVELREVRPSSKEYAYLEGKDGRDQAFRFDPAAKADQRPEWICGNCKQPNPASFDLCWKCNHGRPGRTD
jgi:hypothetical protein